MRAKLRGQAGRSRACHRTPAEALEPRVLLSAGPYHWPAGPETLVNSYTLSSPSSPATAMSADGDYVVTWESGGHGHDLNLSGIYGRRFDAAGVAQGPEFGVNSYTTGGQRYPSIAMDATGDFVVAWQSTGQDGSSYGVYGQRYNAAGVAQGPEFRVNSYTTGNQGGPSVAMDADGDFIVAWTSYGQGANPSGIYAQRYAAQGVPQGGEFRVSAATSAYQALGSVAMDADGDFVVTWSSREQNAYADGVYARRFDAAGVPRGAEFRVDSFTTDYQIELSVAMDADGDFVVTWTHATFDPGSGWVAIDVYARRYGGEGIPQGGQSRVNTFTSNRQGFSTLAMNADGDLVIAWQSRGQDGQDYGVYAQRYDAAGLPQGDEFRVNTFTMRDQYSPEVALSAAGDFVVIWGGLYDSGGRGGVLAQRFTTFGPTSAATVGDRVWHDADANGIQGIGEPGIAGVRVELLNADGVLAATTLTDAAGHYDFTAPAGASGLIGFIRPAGLIPTRSDRGGDDQLDSDADRVTGRTPVFAIGSPGTSDTSFDAGFCAPSSVRGAVFFDRNGDGVRNGGEEGVPGFLVYEDFDGDGAHDADEPAAATELDGTYAINDALGGTYHIAISDQDLWFEPPPAFLTVPIGGTLTGANFPTRTTARDTASVPDGSEFRANTHTPRQQSSPFVAMSADGRFVITWGSFNQDGVNSGGVYAQRYSSAGLPQGPEFRVNTYTTSNQNEPAAAIDDDGDFIIAWNSTGQDGDRDGVYAQRYSATGAPQGPEFRVNSYTTGSQGSPAVAMDAEGNFVIVWSGIDHDFIGSAVYAQLYDATGVPVGTEFRVNATTGGGAIPSVAMDDDGDFVVTWHGDGTVVGDNDIHARCFSASGVPQGAEFRVNVHTTNPQLEPSAAMDADGNFVVTWASRDQDGSGNGIYARRYSAGGVPRGTEFRVNAFTTNLQLNATAAMNATGDFVISWMSYGHDGSGIGVYAQRFNVAGLPQGPEFRVNSYTTDDQWFPSAAMDADGNFAIAWLSDGQDGSDGGVYAQRYAVSTRPAVTASEFVWQSAPQRVEFTFDEDVSGSLSPDDLLLQNLTTSTTIPSSAIGVNWDAATKTAAFSFPKLPHGGALPDGNYRGTLLAGGVNNASGTTIAADYANEFFFLNADANRDHVVNGEDFNILIANFGRTSATFSQGDFNYDGRVTLPDFNILAGRFGTMLSPQSRSAGFTQTPFGQQSIDGDDALREMLA